MPKQTVYVRDEDLEKWKALKDKSTRIHEMLNNIPPTYTPHPTTYQPGETRVPGGSVFVPKPPDPETGYHCCQGRTPCKHWQWDGVQGLYINTLTGKTREAAV